MESLVQADIFFFITSIVMIVIGVLATVLLVYMIKLIRDIYIIAEAVREEAVTVIDDIEEFRKDVHSKAKRLSGILGVITTARFIRRVLRPEDDKMKDDE